MNSSRNLICCLLLLLGVLRARAAEVDGWAVRFCKSNTEAPTVKLYIGVPADTNSVSYWTTWVSNQDERIAVPDHFKDVKAILVRGESEPSKTQVQLCLQYNGNTTKKLVFRGRGEAESKQGDEADCGCPQPEK